MDGMIDQQIHRPVLDTGPSLLEDATHAPAKSHQQQQPHTGTGQRRARHPGGSEAITAAGPGLGELMRDQCDDRPRATHDPREVMGMVANECAGQEQFTAIRKHELILLAENIVEQVKNNNVRGRERCFLDSAVKLLLES